jgi:hypothetical protein
VDGAILWPNSVNTAQIGSTPNRSLCFVMKEGYSRGAIEM